MKCYIAMKGNKHLIDVNTWMNLENMLNKGN